MGRKPGVKAATPKKRASKSTTPNPETLAGLSPDRLIRLILEEVEQNPAFKKRVSAAIAELQGPDAVAALVDRRLAALEKARGFIDWQKRKSFAADLDATLATIMTDLMPAWRSTTSSGAPAPRPTATAPDSSPSSKTSPAAWSRAISCRTTRPIVRLFARRMGARRRSGLRWRIDLEHGFLPRSEVRRSRP